MNASTTTNKRLDTCYSAIKAVSATKSANGAPLYQPGATPQDPIE